MKSQHIFVLAVLAAGVFAAASPQMQADTIGYDLIARGTPNTTIGDIWGLPVSFFDGLTTAQQVSTWGFYNKTAGTEGRNITPFIAKYDSETNNYSITGLGTTRTNDASGVQTFAFGLVSGSATIEKGYTFGWVDGTTSVGNASVAEWDGSGPVILFSYSNDNPDLYLNKTMGAAMPSFTQTLSVQVTASPIPEPSSLVLVGMAICGLVAYAWHRHK